MRNFKLHKSNNYCSKNFELGSSPTWLAVFSSSTCHVLCPDLVRWHFYYHGTQQVALFLHFSVMVTFSSDRQVMCFHWCMPPSSIFALTGGARESKIFSARWSFPLIPYHKACLSQMKWTQNTESKKQGKNVLGQQIINSHTMKCSHNATT